MNIPKIPTIYILGLIVIIELMVNHTFDSALLFVFYGIYKIITSH